MSGIYDIETALASLEVEFREQFAAQASWDEVKRTKLPAGKLDELRERFEAREDEARRRCVDELENLIDFSPRHVRHKDLLADFWAGGSYEKSVFVMTKFPSPGVPEQKDRDLQGVIDAVTAAVRVAGFVPRVASDRDFHPQLWDNVELYLLGCHRGVAIVEDRYLTELNPNVVMEWGWMRSMRKPVLFLLEQGFTRLRADLTGLIQAPFDWDDPAPGVSSAVQKFLKP